MRNDGKSFTAYESGSGYNALHVAAGLARLAANPTNDLGLKNPTRFEAICAMKDAADRYMKNFKVPMVVALGGHAMLLVGYEIEYCTMFTWTGGYYKHKKTFLSNVDWYTIDPQNPEELTKTSVFNETRSGETTYVEDVGIYPRN